jgi:peptidoglycan/LPS O-acetylase OafA/YrhL
LRRAIRLYPLVILATLLGAVPLFVRLAYWGADQRILPDLIVLIKGCLLIPTHSAVEMPGYYDYVFPYDLPMWYLLFDALGFLFFLFVLRFLSLGKLLAVGALMAFGMWAGAIINNGLVFGAVWTTLLPTLPRALFGVTAGYVLFRLYRPNQFMLGPKFALLPVILLLATVFIPVPSSWPYSGELQAFGATFIMPAIIVLSLHINAGPRAAMAARIGSRLSLPVYVLHIPVIVFLNESAVHLLGLGNFPRIPLVALEAASALAFSCLASWYYDEPVRSWLTAKARSWTMGAPALKPGDA